MRRCGAAGVGSRGMWGSPSAFLREQDGWKLSKTSMGNKPALTWAWSCQLLFGCVFRGNAVSLFPAPKSARASGLLEHIVRACLLCPSSSLPFICLPSPCSWGVLQAEGSKGSAVNSSALAAMPVAQELAHSTIMLLHRNQTSILTYVKLSSRLWLAFVLFYFGF